MMSIVFTIALFVWKCQWISNFWYICSVGVVALLLFFFLGVLGYKMVDGFDKDQQLYKCMEHNIKECLECMRFYGFYGVGLKQIDPCEDHEQAPFQYKTDPADCDKCSEIQRRYVVKYLYHHEMAAICHVSKIY